MTDRLVGELSKHVCSYCDIGYHPYCNAGYKKPSGAQETILQTGDRRVYVTLCGPAEGNTYPEGFLNEDAKRTTVQGQKQCSEYDSQFLREQRYLSLLED